LKEAKNKRFYCNANRIPHIYRQTRNKCQYAISHFSVWRKQEEADNTDNRLFGTPGAKGFKTLFFSITDALGK
jgi:hypothetical protein